LIWALLVGYAIGSIPSADSVSRLRGHDLRSSGSGNPGTANALRVAGRTTAATILLIDLAKGAVAVMVGNGLAGSGGAMAAGVAAIGGQVLNPWFRFRGGKGLGVASGVTAVIWPVGMLIVMPVTAVAAKFFRAAGGAILGLAAYFLGAVAWATNDWPTWWGFDPDDRLVWLAIGVIALTAPKFVAELVQRRTSD
jgi:glycerol-3-phosphate acyltransferase PlsY